MTASFEFTSDTATDGATTAGEPSNIDLATIQHTENSELSSHPDVNKSQSDVDTSCGIFSFKPACMQSWNNGKMILAMLCVYGTIQGFACIGLIGVNMASLERRFELSSYQTGLIASSYDITSGLVVAFVAYFSRLGNMPRWVGFSAWMLGIGSLITVLPHVFSDLYQPGLRVADTCPAGQSICISNSNLQNYMYVFILGQIFLGIGGTTLYTTGVIYLDENVSTNTLPLYYGIFEAFTAIGPALGFIVGGLFLDFYVDFDKIDAKSLDMTPEDPRWVGAWWLGFILCTVMAFLSGITFFCFGRESPKAKIYRENRISQVHQDGSDEIFALTDFGTNLKDLPKVTWILLKNPSFMLITLGSSALGLLVSGFGTFIAKYIENQLYQTSSHAALLAGGVLIPGAAGGLFIGGLIVNKMKLKVRGMVKLSILSLVFAIAANGVLFARCDAPKMAGINSGYNKRSLNGVSLAAPCNEVCRCSTASRTPVCGSDGVEYFSACHAGCVSSVNVNADTKLYTNCTCVGDTVSSNEELYQNRTSSARVGLCDTDCGHILPVFLVFLIVVVFLILLPAPPAVSATLRCVPDNAKSYALGIQWVFIRFLGSIPGPLLFGVVMDQSCLIWQEKCGETGSCWMYDNRMMSLCVFGLGVGLSSLGGILYALALFFYKPPKPDSVSEPSTSPSPDAISDTTTVISL
ncbi:solute carrier organic anion transporter family member 4A1-like [Tubulanus polymorphus]|uniref:solute carrier organic anion transporter family member 4A1-like n=1 Tax=Tubulanus polymorphus TaxID=672921 RepID=UPI003DA2720B